MRQKLERKNHKRKKVEKRSYKMPWQKEYEVGALGRKKRF